MWPVTVVCLSVSRSNTVLIEVRGPLTAGDRTALDGRVRALLETDPPTTVVVRLQDSDLCVIDLLACVALQARRTGGRLLVRGDRDLLELCGLGDVLDG